MAFHYSPNIVTDDLVFYLDAANTRSYVSGSTLWNDISRNQNTLSLTNGPTFTFDNGGNIVFDGVDDYVSMGSSINNGQNFSVFSWIKPGNINVRNAIVGNSYPYGASTGWYLSTATNYAGITNSFFISIGADNAYRTASINSIKLNTWNYVGAVVTNGGQNIKLYVNGVETTYFGGILSSNTVLYTTSQFNVGRRFSGTPELFVGSISSIKIYNSLLSDNQILQNYNATKTRFGL